MTESAVAFTKTPGGKSAGSELGERVSQELGGESPDVLILFASPQYDYSELLPTVHEACRPRLLVGCSSAGEFTGSDQGEGSACCVALRSDEMRFSAGLARNLRGDREGAAREIVASFRGSEAPEFRHRSALLLTDALAGLVDDLIESVTLETAGTYQLFGGGAGDDAAFSHTQVFFGTEAVSDAAVSLEILSHKPLGIGVRHGWQPASEPLRVTEAEGMRLVSLNAAPAVEVFEEHAEATGQDFDKNDPIPFFLHNILGIDTGTGYKLRVPLGVNSDGSLSLAADVPVGATVRIMGATATSSGDAAASATEVALQQLDGFHPKVALFFDCVATRLRMGKEFGLELRSVQDALGLESFVGCNTYGQIARRDGQFNGFHNCTAVVCVIPE